MIKFFSWIILILIIVSSRVISANAAVLNWTANENIALSDPAVTLTILANSTSDSLTVRTNRIDVTIAANEQFFLQSPRLLNISGASAQASIGFLCRAGFITELDFRSGGVSQSITIAPQSTTCAGSSGAGGSGGVVVSGGGGGGGGGGGLTSGSLAPPAAAVAAVVPAPLVTQPVPPILSQKAAVVPVPPVTRPARQITSKKTAVVTPGFSLRRSLRLGSRGKDVIALQQFLVANGFLVMPPKTPYGFFGGLTEKAVRLFQEAYGIAQKGNAGYGMVGPLTRKKLNQLLLVPSPKATAVRP